MQTHISDPQQGKKLCCKPKFFLVQPDSLSLDLKSHYVMLRSIQTCQPWLLAIRNQQQSVSPSYAHAQVLAFLTMRVYSRHAMFYHPSISSGPQHCPQTNIDLLFRWKSCVLFLCKQHKSNYKAKSLPHLIHFASYVETLYACESQLLCTRILKKRQYYNT